MQPTPGTTYVSRTRPGVAVHVEDVTTPDRDGFYLVTTCAPDARGDMSAAGHEFTNEEWEAMREQLNLTPAE